MDFEEKFLQIEKIEFIVIGLEPLGNKGIHNCVNHLEWVRKLIPNSISSKKFVHASVFLATKKKLSLLTNDGINGLLIYNYDGILIEYGIYDKKRENDYKGQKVYYLGENGLRYTKYDLMKFQKKVINNNKYKDKLLIKHPLILCNLHSSNLFMNLLHKMFFTSKDSTSDKPLKSGIWLYELFTNSYASKAYEEQWENSKYNIFNHNCQNFVSKVIEVLYATPAIKYDEFKNWNLDIPPIIYNSLQKMIEFTKSKPICIENNIKDMVGEDLFFEQHDLGEKFLYGKVKDSWQNKTKEEKNKIIENINNNLYEFLKGDKFVEEYMNIRKSNKKIEYFNFILKDNYYLILPY